MVSSSLKFKSTYKSFFDCGPQMDLNWSFPGRKEKKGSIFNWKNEKCLDYSFFGNFTTLLILKKEGPFLLSKTPPIFIEIQIQFFLT